MLHIIWGILKFIGILLLVLIALLLLLILSVLFVPLRYKAQGEKTGKHFFVKGNISWLFHVISVTFEYQDSGQNFIIKVFGIPLKLFDRNKKKKKEKALRKSGKSNHKESAVNNQDKRISIDIEELPLDVGEVDSSLEKEPLTELDAGLERDSIPEIEDKAEAKDDSSEKKLNIFQRLKGLISKIKEFFINLKKTFFTFYDRIKALKITVTDIKDFVGSSEFKKALALSKEQGMILLKHIKPRRLRGYVHFGMEDPASTGQILGGISLLYPIFKDNIKILPDFQQKIFEGDFFMKGRIRIFIVLRILWKLYRDKNIKMIIARFRK
jgi:hypothetical protein